MTESAAGLSAGMCPLLARRLRGTDSGSLQFILSALSFVVLLLIRCPV